MIGMAVAITIPLVGLIVLGNRWISQEKRRTHKRERREGKRQIDREE
jgi:hypothetical protein